MLYISTYFARKQKLFSRGNYYTEKNVINNKLLLLQDTILVLKPESEMNKNVPSEQLSTSQTKICG